jgi:hypothetical protein
MLCLSLALALAEPPTVPMLKRLMEDVESSPIKVYAAKDESGRGMDCLKIAMVGRKGYLGICHSRDSRGIFRARLVKSTDLKTWRVVHEFEDHTHQGTLVRLGSEWLVAMEKDGPDGNWIQVRGYDSTADLEAGRHAVIKDLPRQLSRFAEGTPSIDRASVGNGKWNEVDLLIRFHYYRDGDVDRQASGTLTAFDTWASKVERVDNAPLEPTYKGNIGDRDTFNLKGGRFDLLEAQLTKNDWSSWRILLRKRGDAYVRVSPRTEGGSKSFANPTATEIELPDGKPGIVFTMFLPSQGAADGEAGTLIYAKPLPALTHPPKEPE